MKKIFTIIFGLLIFSFSAQTQEKKMIGVIGAVSGKISNNSKILKTGDKIYLGDTILSNENSAAQILLLDQSTFTIGSDSAVVMDTFIYDPKNNDGKIVAKVKKGSLKVISGLVSKKNPDNLSVEVPEGTLGSRGTEFQTIVNSKAKETRTLLIGPGKNNTLGLRPGAVLVSNKFGNTMLNKPYDFTKMKQGSAPDKAKKITKKQLKQFKKKMKAMRVAKFEGSSKEEKKAIRKEIKQSLKDQGFEKEEIKVLIKEEVQKAKAERVAKREEAKSEKKAKKEAKQAKKKEAGEKKKAKKEKAVKNKKQKGKKKKLTKKQKAKNKKAAAKKKAAKKTTKKTAAKKKTTKKTAKKTAAKKKTAGLELMRSNSIFAPMISQYEAQINHLQNGSWKRNP